MIHSIRTRLVFSYFVIAILTASLIYFLIRVTSDQQLKTLILEQEISEILDEVTLWYETEGHWDGFEVYFKSLHPPRPRKDENEERPEPVGKHGIIDSENRVIIRFLNFNPNDIVPNIYLNDALPVIVEDAIIAWIIPDDVSGISLEAEEAIYLNRTNQVLLIAISIAVVSALLIGYGFAFFLLRPILALITASEAMADGKLRQKVDIHSRDELGQLITSFNKMSHEVATANQRRRQMTANIAHDLSTPLQIIAGYIETIQDGTMEATPERLNIIADEIELLRRLVNDLDILAQTDTNTLSLNLENLTLIEFLPQMVARFQPLAHKKNIVLELNLDTVKQDIPSVYVDQERLIQILDNLIHNALRYTPDGGLISLSIYRELYYVCLKVEDNGVGIAEKDLPFILDRFYQVDQSRHNRGKMGLGLSIVKALVIAMGGEISIASDGVGQGTTFIIKLPQVHDQFISV